MSLTEIQQAVETLPADERARLTAWIVSRYPLLKVEPLMASAAKLAHSGDWAVSPPTDENQPKGKILAHATRVAEKLDLGK